MRNYIVEKITNGGEIVYRLFEKEHPQQSVAYCDDYNLFLECAKHDGDNIILDF